MLNVGVIGAGVWGKNHVRVLSELDDVNLVNVADLDAGNLNGIGKTHNIKTTTDHKEILNDPEIKAVSICTPASTHYKVIKEALEADKHVLVEKPLTLNSVEGEELVKLAEEKNKVLMVGHIFRFNPGVIRLKEEIKKGTLGKVYFMYGSRMGLMTPRSDCGVIFDFALHDIDTFCFLLDDKPIEIKTVSNSYTKSEFEDVGFITLKFKDEILANVGVSWLSPVKTRDLWVVGEKKSAKLDYLTQELEIFDKGIIEEKYEEKYDSFGAFKLITKQGDDLKLNIENKEPLKEEIAHFVDCVINNKKPIVDGKIGLEIVKIIENIIKK